MNLATLLTASRLVLIAPIASLAFTGTNRTLALTLFCLAAVTDYFDGMVARHFKQVTATGARLDASVDKLLIYVLVIILYMRGTYLLPIVLMAFTRDGVVELLRQRSAATREVIPANTWGKVKFIVQCASVAVALWSGSALTLSSIAANMLLLLATIASLPGVLVVWKAATGAVGSVSSPEELASRRSLARR